MNDNELLESLWDKPEDKEIDYDYEKIALIKKLENLWRKPNVTKTFLKNHTCNIYYYFNISSNLKDYVSYEIDLSPFYSQINNKPTRLSNYFQIEWDISHESLKKQVIEFVTNTSNFLFEIEIIKMDRNSFSENELKIISMNNIIHLTSHFITQKNSNKNLVKIILRRITNYFSDPEAIESRSTMIKTSYSKDVLESFYKYKNFISEDELISLTDQTIKIETIHDE